MRIAPALILATLFCAASPAHADQEGDRVAVYRAFLADYTEGSDMTINLGNRSTEIDLSGSDLRECTSGFPISGRDSTPQTLTGEIIGAAPVRLVDAEAQRSAMRDYDPGEAIRRGASVEDAVAGGFDNGLLTLSEVVFDRTGDHAALQFSFVCGALCGHGGTAVFNRVGHDWVQSERECGDSWIS